MIVIGVAVCCSKRRKRTKPRQVKYIVKPQNPGQDNTKPKLPEHVGNGVRIPDILASSQMHGDAHTFEGSYRPNIMPTETDLDEDLKHGYDNGMYNGEPPKGVYTINAEFNDGLQFTTASVDL
ncbi:hypothetical protein EB796_010451 [Bugula neritina]|uniref:Uncharacterized protein n=1 Tax=Bugula neritina TaxID=10212 RepID=A0A7J7JZA7_BUGNE|nr:hypothetical protein EB796_010451 [Bugula neritina]